MKEKEEIVKNCIVKNDGISLYFLWSLVDKEMSITDFLLIIDKFSRLNKILYSGLITWIENKKLIQYIEKNELKEL